MTTPCPLQKNSVHLRKDEAKMNQPDESAMTEPETGAREGASPPPPIEGGRDGYNVRPLTDQPGFRGPTRLEVFAC